MVKLNGKLDENMAKINKLELKLKISENDNGETYKCNLDILKTNFSRMRNKKGKKNATIIKNNK